MESCDRVYDKLTLIDNGLGYRDNGVNWLLRFTGLNENPGQFEIMSSTVTPLTGDNITYSSTTPIPYSTNLFYEPIPFEFLKTYETKPQLLVEVDGLPVVCHNLTCDFTYTQPVGEVTSFTFDAPSKKLVLTGTNLPDSVSKIRHVIFSLSECEVNPATLSATNLECTLKKEPTCGSYVPTLTSVLGVVPNSASLTAQTVSCSISSALPITDMNLLGGDNITFSGEYFPHTLKTSTVSIKFSDAK